MSSAASRAAPRADGEDEVVAPLASRLASASLQSSSAASSAHGHRPSAAGGLSMDLSDESRDTVEVKDSDKWYPQFSPSASLVPARKLSEEKQTGLNALLQNRMDRARFQERFLPEGSPEAAAAAAALASRSPAIMAAKEASAESLFNRSAKLGALLANRPSKDRLEAQNIIKAPQGTPNRATNQFAGLQQQLEASKRKDKLNTFLGSRPSVDAMVKRGIVQDERKASEPRERLASAKTVLGDFMLSRPNPEQLIKQKIISDIGDLPGGLERGRQENALVGVSVTGGSLAAPGKKVTQVSLGFSHTLVLDSEGLVHVFGSGANGRLGVGEGLFGDVVLPTCLGAAAFSNEKVVQVDAGENHSAAVTAGGKLFMWGTGAWGRLGLGSQEDASVPREVPLLGGAEQAQAVSAGAYHTLVLTKSGKLLSMGWNKNGRCGLGRKHPSLLVLTPTEIPFFSQQPVDAAAASAAASAAAAAGADSPSAPAPSSSGVPSAPISFFEAGQGSSFAVTRDGRLYTFGTGSFGVLGHGDEADQWEPRLVEQVAHQNIVRAALGATHMVLSTDKGLLLSFGSNDKHQLGRVTTDDAPVAATAAASSSSSSSSSSSASLPSSSSFSSVAPVSTPASLFTPASVCFGSGSAPVLVGVRFLAAGKSHTLLVDGAGSLWAWGLGARGVLGLGSEADQPVPVRVDAGDLKAPPSAPLVSADAAWTHSAAVTEAGVLVTFGAKNNGRLGF